MITSNSTVDNSINGMEGGESPLDVLSRAATMLQQENQQTSLSLTEDVSKNNLGQRQTTKWKRDRRRLPEYSRKSDPKIPETFGVEPSSPEASVSNGANIFASLNNAKITNENGINGADTPLDMSVRQRGLPPSYAQTISNPGYRSSYRPSVIHNGVPTNREDLPSGISMCDPIIDEHFRRSLGNDYHTLFQNNNTSKEKDVPPKVLPKTTTNVIELMDSSGLSVDDHFAKALGDTWTKLNKKEDIKSSSNENNLLSISN